MYHLDHFESFALVLAVVSSSTLFHNKIPISDFLRVHHTFLHCFSFSRESCKPFSFFFFAVVSSFLMKIKTGSLLIRYFSLYRRAQSNLIASSELNEHKQCWLKNEKEILLFSPVEMEFLILLRSLAVSLSVFLRVSLCVVGNLSDLPFCIVFQGKKEIHQFKALGSRYSVLVACYLVPSHIAYITSPNSNVKLKRMMQKHQEIVIQDLIRNCANYHTMVLLLLWLTLLQLKRWINEITAICI